METIRLSSTKEIAQSIKGGVVALGNFDGVHLGHQSLIQKASDIAKTKKVPLLVLTFEPHPRIFFESQSFSKSLQTNRKNTVILSEAEESFERSSSSPPFLLTPLNSKKEKLSKQCVDTLLLQEFNNKFAETNAEDFIKKFLVEKLEISHLVTGYDCCFGKDRKGTIGFLEEISSKYGFGFSYVKPVLCRDGEAISSSKIRQFLRDGKVADATAILGTPWTISGTVEDGKGQGKQLGFPTLNLSLADYLHPKFGVYAARVAIEENAQKYMAIVNIGKRPTLHLDDAIPILEAHIFNFSGNIYGKRVYVSLIDFIRSEQKFSSVDELKKQIKNDCERVTKNYDY